MPNKTADRLERFAVAVTKWIGSPQSIMLHTALFSAAIVVLAKGLFPFDIVILILNTAVSLEAIYLALFIQMSVNIQSRSLEDVEQDIDEIQEDIDEMQKDVDELQEDVEEIAEGEKGSLGARHPAPTLADMRATAQKLLHDLERLERGPQA